MDNELQSQLSPKESKKKTAVFPKSVPYLLGNEAAERFSFYGMKAILAIFLVEMFQFSDAQSNATVHLFIALCYFMSIVGGLLADWYLGKYKTILYLSLIYCAGHGFLAMFDHSQAGFLTGLLLISIGAGGIKPCVSANIGDQFDKTNQSLISKMFNWFYLCINIGSIVSIAVTPILKEYVGPRLAFGVPGILMAVATFVFWLGRKKYVMLQPKGFPKENFVNINWYMLTCLFKKVPGKTARQRAEEKYNPKKVDGIIAVWRVLAIFAFFPIYWALYDQNGSEWVLQAQFLNLNFFGFNLLPSQIQFANPFLIIVLVPIFTVWVYPFIKKLGIKITALRKMGTGLVFLGLAFLVIAFLQIKVNTFVPHEIKEKVLNGGMKYSQIGTGLRSQFPSLWWQFLAYTLLTISEVLLSITGLEYAYTQAPKSMKSTIMAFFLMTVFVGDFFDTLVNLNIQHGGVLSRLEGNASYYWFFLIILGILTIGYFFVSYFIKEKSYLVDEEDEGEADIVAESTG